MIFWSHICYHGSHLTSCPVFGRSESRAVVTRRRGFMAKKERSITDAVIADLRRIPWSFVQKIPGTRMARGLPDLYFTCKELNGRSVWIEMKRPGEEPTPQQAHRLSRLREAGCVSIVGTSVESVRAALRAAGVTFPSE